MAFTLNTLPPHDEGEDDDEGNGNGNNRNNGNGRGNGNRGNEAIDENLSLDSVGGLTEQVRYMKDHVLYAFKNQQALRDAWGYEPEKGKLIQQLIYAIMRNVTLIICRHNLP